MQSIYWTGRLLSRALWNGLTSSSSTTTTTTTTTAATIQSRVTSCPDAETSKHCGVSFVSAVCGFPKDFHHGGRIRKGQFGDDAWFAAKFKAVEVIGVADGVGGWRHYGIDPGEFSSFLMRTCERLVSMGRFAPTEPAGLLAQSYHELLENKQAILGSSTACVVVLNKETSSVYAANIGDSGFVVVRKGRMVHRSSEQQHYFNTPFQLSLPPPGHSGLVLSDSPESADTSSFDVEDGDVILLATDGVFDNVPDQLLVTEMQKIEGERDPTKIQGVANSIAWMARSLAFDGAFVSPFAQSARQNGIDAIGGKPDDITVLLATVAM